MATAETQSVSNSSTLTTVTRINSSMKPIILATIGFALSIAIPPAPASETLKRLTENGAFGFPQAKATVVCDTEDLRVSAWNDAANLFVQAFLWRDDDDSVTELPDGRTIGDRSYLWIDVNADGKLTKNIDRCYCLNPWPEKSGLWYFIPLSGKVTLTTVLLGDSNGRGSIRYIETTDGKVRVDSFVIPLTEIGLKAGRKIRFAYFCSSPEPEIEINSVGFRTPPVYHGKDLPWKKFHRFSLTDDGETLDAKNIPDGRTTKK